MKSMRWLGIFVIGILVILFLAACQPPAPSPTPEPLQAEPTATPTTPPTVLPGATDSYPAPEVTSAPISTDDGYPAPATTSPGQSTPASGIGSGYPVPSESIPWVQARTLILDGQVTQVTQLHSLKVILVLEDGRTVETFEPAIDTVFDVIDECGEKCSDIIIATE
ncbi:MAG TPA: hypothetical protein VGA03_05545 [Anaerolineales bacterium]